MAMINNCLTCKNSTYCTKCNSVNLYPYNDQCVHCIDRFTACDECSFEAGCTKCLSDEYYLKAGSCHICADSLDGCLRCNGEAICTKCNIPKYYLDEVSQKCKLCSTIIIDVNAKNY